MSSVVPGGRWTKGRTDTYSSQTLRVCLSEFECEWVGDSVSSVRGYRAVCFALLCPFSCFALTCCSRSRCNRDELGRQGGTRRPSAQVQKYKNSRGNKSAKGKWKKRTPQASTAPCKVVTLPQHPNHENRTQPELGSGSDG